MDDDLQIGKKYSFKRRKWDPKPDSMPNIPLLLPSDFNRDQLESLLLKIRMEEINHQLATNKLDLEVNRSPSPEPIYDSTGKRTNTREQRAREKLTNERQNLIERAIKLNPLFKPPADYKPTPVKKIERSTFLLKKILVIIL